MPVTVTTDELWDALRARCCATIRKALDWLSEFSRYEANWDGLGAAKPEKKTLLEAKIFLVALSRESTVPDPTLHANGNAVLLICEDDSYLELEFCGDGQAEYYARRGAQEWSGVLHVGSSAMPEGLSILGLQMQQQPSDAEVR